MPSKRQGIMLRLEEEYYKELKHYAEEDERPIANLTAKIIKQWLQERKAYDIKIDGKNYHVEVKEGEQ